MSSARKRAAIQKAHNEVDRLRQRLMLAENHIAILRTMAEAIGRGGDVMCEALKKIASPTQTTDLLWWQIVAREALAKVGADGTADKGSNVQGDRRCAASSRSVQRPKGARSTAGLDEAATRRNRLLRHHELFCTFIPSILMGLILQYFVRINQHDERYRRAL